MQQCIVRSLRELGVTLSITDENGGAISARINNLEKVLIDLQSDFNVALYQYYICLFVGIS